MRVFSILACLPFLGIFVQTYLTAYYAREWGNMISQGMELTQIFQIMQEQGSRLFKEIGQDLAQALQNGREFSQTIATYPFFKKELSLIIEYGEVKSKLGSELEIYSEKLGKLFYPSQPHHESGAATGFYLCGSAYRFTLCGNAHAHVSKYGGEFLKWKKWCILEKS